MIEPHFKDIAVKVLLSHHNLEQSGFRNFEATMYQRLHVEIDLSAKRLEAELSE